MGQRTQVLVIKEKNNGERKSHFFHIQWGFGRIMYLGLIDLLLQDYNKDTFKDGYSFLDCKFATNEKIHDISDGVPEDVLNNASVKNFDSIRKVFEYGDNNNGGMVVYIKESKEDYGSAKFKVGFLLGEEDIDATYNGERYNEGNDKEPFARWLTPTEYGKMNGGHEYSDDKFVRICNSFFKYFGVEYLKN